MWATLTLIVLSLYATEGYQFLYGREVYLYGPKPSIPVQINGETGCRTATFINFETALSIFDGTPEHVKFFFSVVTYEPKENEIELKKINATMLLMKMSEKFTQNPVYKQLIRILPVIDEKQTLAQFTGNKKYYYGSKYYHAEVANGEDYVLTARIPLSDSDVQSNNYISHASIKCTEEDKGGAVSIAIAEDQEVLIALIEECIWSQNILKTVPIPDIN